MYSANTDARDGPVNPYNGKWSINCYFMNEYHNLRIKPRKRWIAVHPDKDLLISNGIYKSRQEAEVICGPNCEFLEIEF